ncbi:MAG: tripartite tricarboxylate transporter TctB family protein [Spirochaetales bacterium]|jgi:uncharacterized membrane protein YidH (DUF202 family)|nr:tripartite tricarboxylate transporter TctB family protein [Spirochaetales bacterium]
MTEKSMARSDFYTGIALIAFGLAVTVMALQMPPVTERGQSPYSAPGLLPALLGGVIIVLSAVMFVRAVRKLRGEFTLSRGGVKNFFAETGTRRMSLTIFLCLAYVLSLGRIFFPLATFLFVFIFVLVFEYEKAVPVRAQKKKFALAALLAGITSAAVTGVFQYIFLVNLP